MTAAYTGSCKCGAIKVELQGEPQVARKTTGSTYSTNAVFTRSAFTLTSGTPKVYEQAGGSGRPAYVNFCGDCSSTMWTATPSMPDIVVIKVGVLDGDALERIVPKAETFTARRPGWMGCVEGAAQFEHAYAAPAK